jgi:glycosyltransferase involved in cell wall biosynthesis
VRVLLVHNFYRWRGGEDEFIERLAGLLRAHGHSVEVFAAHSNTLAAQGIVKRLRAIGEAFYSVSAAHRLNAVLDNFQPDVLHVQNVFPLLSPAVYSVAHHRQVPVVHTIQNFRFLCPNGLAFTHGRVCFRCEKGNTWPALVWRCLHGSLSQSALYAGVIGWHRWRGTLATQTGHLLPVNTFLAKRLRAAFPAAPITVLPNSIATADYRPVDERTRRVIYMGRLSVEKGVRDLLQAVALTPKVELDVVGDGPLRVELEKLAQTKLPGRVVFHGFIAGTTRFEQLARAAALVVPSLWHEACPLVVLEAMALGVPVIGTRMGGLPDLIVDGETGWLVEPNQVTQLAEALNRVVQEWPANQRIGRAARQRAVSSFDDTVYYRRLMAIYEQRQATA